jgi:hypothetical protein
MKDIGYKTHLGGTEAFTIKESTASSGRNMSSGVVSARGAGTLSLPRFLEYMSMGMSACPRLRYARIRRAFVHLIWKNKRAIP